jgi:phage virion morphogenesis protein
VNVTMTIDDADVQAALKRLVAKVGNMHPAMKLIGQEYEKRVRRNFDTESDPEGKPWPKLSPVTMMLDVNRKKGFNKKGGLNSFGRQRIQTRKILNASGDLMENIHHQASPTSAVIGVGGSIKYGAIHQFGGQAGRNRKVTIPARPYLALKKGTNQMELAQRDKAAILDIIEGYIAKAVTA